MAIYQASSASTTTPLMQYWCESTSASNSIVTWRNWTSRDLSCPEWKLSPIPAPPTPEELERRQLRLETERRRSDELQLNQNEAHAKAEALLLQNLSEDQQNEYQTHKKFHVISQSGKRYEIRSGWGHNVDEQSEIGSTMRKYCLVHKERVPMPDLMLTQKLMLEMQESEFLRIANAS